MERNISRLGKFYIIVTLVLAVAGIIAYVVAKNNAEKSINSLTSTTVKASESYAYEEPTEANNAVTDVPDERYTEESKTEVPEPEIVREKEFCLPMGSNILKDYSNGELVYSETMEDWRAHTGVDFAANKGSEIVSINNGKVLRVYDSSLYGTTVEIDHGDGLVAKYCPIDPDGYIINEGDTVARGQKIGTLGVIPIESADSEHLHFEIKQDGKNVDPIKAMGKTRDSLG